MKIVEIEKIEVEENIFGLDFSQKSIDFLQYLYGGDKAILYRSDNQTDLVDVFLIRVKEIVWSPHETYPILIDYDLIDSTSVFKSNIEGKSNIELESFLLSNLNSNGHSVKYNQNETSSLNDGFRICQTKEEKAKLRNLAEMHPFRYKFNSLEFIYYKNGEVEGGVSVSPSDYSEKKFGLKKYIFKKNLTKVEQNSVMINRIYSKPKYLKAHQKIIHFLIDAFKPILKNYYAVIEGISYDYLPAAVSCGAKVWPPNQLDAPYYYYILLNSNGEDFGNSKKIKIEIAKDIKRKRKELNYWIIYGKRELLLLSLKHSFWKLINYELNKTAWLNIKQGDVLFLCDYEVKKLIGMATVKSKSENMDEPSLIINYKDSYGGSVSIFIGPKYINTEKGLIFLNENVKYNWFKQFKQSEKVNTTNMKSKFWLAITNNNNIKLVFNYKAWAISDNTKNLNRWNSLNSGDIVFIYNKSNFKIEGFGTVKSKEKDYSGRYSNFPLLIRFIDLKENSNINFSEREMAKHIELKGGIIELNEKLGETLFIQTSN